jgi:hypothetical protein
MIEVLCLKQASRSLSRIVPFHHSRSKQSISRLRIWEREGTDSERMIQDDGEAIPHPLQILTPTPQWERKVECTDNKKLQTY